MNTSRDKIRNKIFYIIIFSIAMGFFESAVVIYLRMLYYPEGFSFPLKIMSLEELSIEYLREFSAIVMLLTVAVVAGKKFYERFSYFLICFGIWDIFYYVWLKVLLDWPESLFTWDILFLIPVVWAGPVLAPVICAFTMVALGGSVLYFLQKGHNVVIKISEWTILFVGSLIILITFLWEYSKIIIEGGFLSQIETLATDPYFQQAITSHIPVSFKWTLFIIGEAFLISSLVLFCWRTTKSR